VPSIDSDKQQLIKILEQRSTKSMPALVLVQAGIERGTPDMDVHEALLSLMYSGVVSLTTDWRIELR
jgi:hypothetical protein